jgi:hypothetical protein
MFGGESIGPQRHKFTIPEKKGNERLVDPSAGGSRDEIPEWYPWNVLVLNNAR